MNLLFRFNSDGTLKEFTGGNLIQSSVKSDTLYVKVDDVDVSNFVAMAEYKRPDGQVSNDIAMAYGEVPFGLGDGFRQTIPAWCTQLDGQLEITIRLLTFTSNGDKRVFAMAKNVVKVLASTSAGDGEVNITDEQYDALLETLANKSLNEVVGKDVEEYLNQKFEEKSGLIDEYLEEQTSRIENEIDTELKEMDDTIKGLGDLKPSGTAPSSSIISFKDNVGIYIGEDDGNWYYWKASEQRYVVGGVYQATEIADGSVTINKFEKGLKNLYNQIKETKISSNFEWETNKAFYAMNNEQYPFGSVGNFNNNSICYLSLNGGEELVLKTISYNDLISVYVLYDENNNYISQEIRKNSSPALQEFKINVPNNARKIGLSCTTEQLHQFEITLPSGNFKISIENVEINNNSKQFELIINDIDITKDKQESELNSINPYKYPLTDKWGWEYLQHWYEKIYELSSCKIVLEGDSITEGYVNNYPNKIDCFKNMRGYHIKKIMKVGNFPLENLSLINNGHGGRSSNEWVGNATYGNPTYIEQYQNGFLDVAMKENPDLLIICWGTNDADKTNTLLPATIEERLVLYEANMREGLQRIRGNTIVNGRPYYNKPLSDLSIIICTPTACDLGNSGRTNDKWYQYIRKINQKLCREFGCAFVDFNMRTYTNSYLNNTWGQLESDGITRSGIHPNKYQDAQITSTLQDLIFPISMWNVSIE